MNLTSFRKIAGLCLFVAASVPLANLSHAQGMNPNFVVDRLDSLVHLNSAQRAAAIDIVTRENSALQAFAPGQERAIKGMPIRQAARAQIRAILTPDQQKIYDITPQSEGGGATVNAANRTSDLDRSVTLTDAQVMQVAAIYQKQVEALAALPPQDRTGLASIPIVQATKAAVRAVLTPEQQAKFDANPNSQPDMEEKAYVVSAIRSSSALAARLGAITRVRLSESSISSVNDQLLNGEYHYRVTGATGSETLTIQWKRTPSTGTFVIVKVAGEDGLPIQL